VTISAPRKLQLSKRVTMFSSFCLLLLVSPGLPVGQGFSLQLGEDYAGRNVKAPPFLNKTEQNRPNGLSRKRRNIFEDLFNEASSAVDDVAVDLAEGFVEVGAGLSELGDLAAEGITISDTDSTPGGISDIVDQGVEQLGVGEFFDPGFLNDPSSLTNVEDWFDGTGIYPEGVPLGEAGGAGEAEGAGGDEAAEAASEGAESIISLLSRPTTKGSKACEKHSLVMSCQPGEEIQVLKAAYGRRTNRTCPTSTYNNLASLCRAKNSLKVVSDRCNDRERCSVEASNTMFGDPCYGVEKYLEVLYTCKPKNKNKNKNKNENKK